MSSEDTELERYESAISEALRADAESARAEIRAAGIICPSCEVNMADLPAGHSLAVYGEAGIVTECAAGEPFTLAAGDGLPPMSPCSAWQAIVNIQVWDDYNRCMDVAMRELIGEARGEFTGLLDIKEAK